MHHIKAMLNKKGSWQHLNSKGRIVLSEIIYDRVIKSMETSKGIAAMNKFITYNGLLIQRNENYYHPEQQSDHSVLSTSIIIPET